MNTINYRPYTLQRAIELVKGCKVIQSEGTEKVKVLRVNSLGDNAITSLIGTVDTHVVVFQAMTRDNVNAAFEMLKELHANGETEVDAIELNNFFMSAADNFTNKELPLKGELVKVVIEKHVAKTEAAIEKRGTKPYFIVTGIATVPVNQGVSAEGLFDFNSLMPETDESSVEESHDLEDEEIVGKVEAGVLEGEE